MTDAWAGEISAWKYPGEYAIYSFEPDGETMAELLSGDYYACADARGMLIGYFCFGNAARIPCDVDYASDETLTDIGLGLAPRLCGMGRGREFMKSGMDFAKTRLNSRRFRLAVAAFNKRAITLYLSMGFREVLRVRHAATRAEFIIMQKSEEQA